MNSLPNMLRIAFSVVIDYFRWTQLFPMMAAWTISVGLLLIIVLDSNHETVNQGMSSFESWIERNETARTVITSAFEYIFSEEEAEKPFFEAFRSVVFKIWGFGSLVLMALAWLAGLLFGPFEPWKLKRKLGLTALAFLALVSAFVLCYFVIPDQFNGPFHENMIGFTLIGVAVFVVSTWSLVISQILGAVARSIAEPPPTEPALNTKRSQ